MRKLLTTTLISGGVSALLLVASPATADTPADKQAKQPAGKAAPAPTDKQWQQMRSEILSIRRQLGINPLAGTALADPPGAKTPATGSFASTLDNVAGARKSSKPASGKPRSKTGANADGNLKLPVPPVGPNLPQIMPLQPAKQLNGPPVMEPQLPPVIEPQLPPVPHARGSLPLLPGMSGGKMPALSYRDTLLAAARQLDRKADFLEDSDNLSSSRKIRRLAKRLRSEALGQSD